MDIGVGLPSTITSATGKDVPHPLFVFLEGHEPEFLRDLGV